VFHEDCTITHASLMPRFRIVTRMYSVSMWISMSVLFVLAGKTFQTNTFFTILCCNYVSRNRKT